MADNKRLHDALKQLSRDVRTLVDLSVEESDESWQQMVDTVKQEISEESRSISGAAHEKDEGLFVSLVTEIYDHLGILIKRIKNSQEKLKTLATRDLLTGLYNRNYFNEVMLHDIQKANRYKESLSFILLDIDKFKLINDNYGHLYGDGIIKACATILHQSIRKSDFLCRYGGDEFVIVTPMADCKRNEALFSRLQQNIDKWNSKFSCEDVFISMSLGCAIWEPGMDVVDVLHKADLKMYEMKQQRKL